MKSSFDGSKSHPRVGPTLAGVGVAAFVFVLYNSSLIGVRRIVEGARSLPACDKPLTWILRSFSTGDRASVYPVLGPGACSAYLIRRTLLS
jgi:hypothetical protein